MADCGVIYETLVQHFGHAVANNDVRKKQQGKVRYMTGKFAAMNPDAVRVFLYGGFFAP